MPGRDSTEITTEEISTVTSDELKQAQVAESLRETPRALPVYPAVHSSPPPVPRASAAPRPTSSVAPRHETPIGMPAPVPGAALQAPARPRSLMKQTTMGVAPPSPSAAPGPPRRSTPLGVPTPPAPAVLEAAQAEAARLEAKRARASQMPVAPAVGAPPVESPPVEAPAPAGEPTDLTLSSEMQEQLFGILRAALDASLAPLLQKQKELEARITELKALEGQAAAASERADTAEKRAFAAERRAANAEASASTRPPVRSVAPSIPVDLTPSGSTPAISSPAISSVAPTPRTSIVPASFGYVTVGTPSKRPPIEEALAKVGPVDVPDFGSKKRMGTILLVVLIGGALAAMIAMALSYT